jgi:hypothetical protein
MTKSVARQVFVPEWIVLTLSLACTILLEASDPPTVKINARNAPFVKIGAIIKSPKAFDQTVVSFVGLLRMDGNYLVLYQNEHDALAHNFAKSIYVETFTDAPSYRSLNNHWLKVTGMIRATKKDGLVTPSRFHPCELILVNAAAVKRPPLRVTNTHPPNSQK